MTSLDALRAAVEISPHNVPLLNLLGQAYLDGYFPGEAREAFERALQLDERNQTSQLGLARALAELGKTSEAVVRMESYLAEHPQDVAAWVLLSRTVLSEGMEKEAWKHYDHARGLTGFVPDAGLEKEFRGPPTASLEGRRVIPSAGERMEESTDHEEVWHDSGERLEAGGALLERSPLTFAHVGGMEAVKEEIRMKILYPMQNADLFRAYGKKAGGGVLLYGPPGCGKTMISRATAGEIKANFLSIGIHQILDLYLGNSEKNLHEIFEMARANAPTVLFFDEVDALAADRTDLKRSAGRTLINQFLTEMDCTNGNNEGLLILGATNAPWHIDPAFRRPGRFDRVLFVPPPDTDARAAILRILARDKPVADFDPRALAGKTKDFSGADLNAVFERSIEAAIGQAMTTGRMIPLTTKHLLEAVKMTKPSTRAWFDSAKNYALYANQGGFYNDVLAFLGITK